MMQNYIDILRQLNYELVKELGLFKHRAGLSFSQRHILYHIKNNISLSIQELADFLHVEHSTMSRNIKKLVQAGLVDIYQDEKGNDLHGMAQIIIAKHRKGSVGDVLLNFRGEFTRFQDPQDAAAAPVEEGGEIVGSRMNGGGQDGSPLPPPPAENLPF